MAGDLKSSILLGDRGVPLAAAQLGMEKTLVLYALKMTKSLVRTSKYVMMNVVAFT